MGFKKTKLSKLDFSPKNTPETLKQITNVRDQYLAVKERNSIVSIIGMLLASACIGFLGFVALFAVSGIHFNFSIPQFVTHSLPFLKTNSEPEKVNILLTGVGGAGHDGSDLTDTIILASINRRSNTVSMLSIPRDLYVEFDAAGTRRGKVNETYQRALKNSTPEEAMAVL